jgi:hypothetical protein
MSRARPNNNDWEAWVQKGSSNGNATTSVLSTTEEFKAAHDAATTHRQLTGEPASAPPDASVCQRLAYRLANATFFALCFIYVCFAAVESMVVRHKKKMIFLFFFFVFRFSIFVFRFSEVPEMAADAFVCLILHEENGFLIFISFCCLCAPSSVFPN